MRADDLLVEALLPGEELPHLELRDDLLGEHAQGAQLELGEPSRSRVEDAERPQREAVVLLHERDAGEEA